MFAELSTEEHKIVELLRKVESSSIDEINFMSGLSSSAVATALLNLEMQGILKSLPGKRYSLTD